VQNAISHALEKRALHQAVGNALRSGTGVYSTSWPAAGIDDRRLAEALLSWCRSTLGTMHRPYGIDGVSLALLARDRKRPLASVRFSLLRPADFDASGRAETDARDVLQTWWGEGIFSKRGVLLSALLFSWGDLTQELAGAS
jgi:hypothetical protein